ncbi:saccharopine dehydrogenase NADP-binding domain-containing protein [Sansalvadorimonas sp. 2012CJ34-2]|uniref:Saccharopine dehydrogenase NADP-binding domain-containing protein n=1 Tax=Parendozoicomonas callyspongiae TaxID=2942213 RepID=A0ABT0PBU3_9GAMM|nr:saccharopine dehydrogenase NADP-binding domain-containing protein [Sansalvadorimonas sp. 2012CJ34-2]MCL6268849.1 saccharopine dehydrogenase NADP-binding domain-containing protein [Sansalvadorimonas sp. 2012CJ34-2]
MTTPRYDLIVFGATSFVGQILVRYFVQHLSCSSKPILWAMAGRSEPKLQRVRNAITGAEDIPIIVADASDEAALRRMCEEAKVVISTVGPYALHGETLVKCCAETGTDYCDLAGELPWIRLMISRYEKTARKSGARIVSCCGFDSIPFDLGVAYLQKQAKERFGVTCSAVKMRLKAAKGGASGGTVASIINVVKEATFNADMRRELANHYSLCPDGHGFTIRQPETRFAVYDQDFQSWTAPFIMAALNTRVVHRTNALLGHAYGNYFLYDEAVMTGHGLKGRWAAMTLVAGLTSFFAGAAIKPARWIMQKFLLPEPGEGPSPKAQENGFYDLRFKGWTVDGKEIQVKVTGDRDPGYGSTARMLGQAGLSLACDIERSECGGGFWTPASIFDERMFDRLKHFAGLKFEVTG